MDSLNVNGTSNFHYAASNGTLNIPSNRFSTRQCSLPNGKLSFDRLNSCTSTTIGPRFENTSILKLVMDTTEKSKLKYYCKLKCAFWTLFLLSILIISILSSLYVVELNKREEVSAVLYVSIIRFK